MRIRDGAFLLAVMASVGGCSAPHTVGTGFMGLQSQPEPGYKWADPDSLFSRAVVWTPNQAYPDLPHLRTSDREGVWTSDYGYSIEKDPSASIGLAARWAAGASYKDLPHMLTSQQEGQWSAQAGYMLQNNSQSPIGLSAAWSPGASDPVHPHIHASAVEGRWDPDQGYTWAAPDDPNNLDVVAAASDPDYTPLAHAGLKWCSEAPDDPDSEGWFHWGMRQMCGIGAIATER